MPLETLQKDAPIRVKNLSVEVPTKGPRRKFDLERDIPPQVKGQIIQEPKIFNVTGLAPNVVPGVYDAKFLFPDELPEVTLSSQTARQMLEDEFYAPDIPVLNYQLIPIMRSLSPSTPLPFSRENHESMAEYARIRIEGVDLNPREEWALFSSNIPLAVKMYSPDKVSNLNPSSEFLGITAAFLDYLGSWDRREVFGSAQVAASLRILFWPDTPPFVPSHKHWQKLQQRLKEVCDSQLDNPDSDVLRFIVRLAKSMQILAADEIIITENGIEPVFKQPEPEIQAQPIPLPESKRY